MEDNKKKGLGMVLEGGGNAGTVVQPEFVG